MSDTVFSPDFATRIATASFRFSTPTETRPFLGGLGQTLRQALGGIDAHDAIEQATVWASLAGGGFFVAAMVAAAFN